MEMNTHVHKTHTNVDYYGEHLRASIYIVATTNYFCCWCCCFQFLFSWPSSRPIQVELGPLKENPLDNWKRLLYWPDVLTVKALKLMFR